MKNLLIICQVYVIFVASSGFLFGQFFFGNFDVPSTVAGIFGILAGSFGLGWIRQNISVARKCLLIFFCAAGIAGVFMDAYDYYVNHHFPGNDYDWFLIGPFCLALAVIAYSAMKQIRDTTSWKKI